MFKAIHAAFHEPETRIYQITQTLIWLLIALSILLFSIGLWLGSEHEISRHLDRIDQVVLWIFAIEILLRVLSYRPPALDFFHLSAPGRLRTAITGRLLYCLQPLNLIDILTVAALVPELRGLRAIRLLRLLRTPKMFRYSQPLEGLARAFRENALLFFFAFSVLGVSVLIGGTSMYLAERDLNPAIDSIADGLWWALVTITTVGFGDISPVTAVGRIVGAVLMVLGMFTLALFAGIVGTTLLRSVLTLREETFRMSGYMNHIVICGYDAGARMLLDNLLEEIDPSRTPAVIFAEGDRLTDIPAEFVWVEGDPTKESELAKVRLQHAAVAVLVGGRSIDPQSADARTILTAFTIRSYLRSISVSHPRKKPLYIVAEVLDSENVAHAKTAGADEVIETTHIGFSLVAHAINIPGTAALVGKIATTDGQSLFVGEAPAGDESPVSFGQIAYRLREEMKILVVGVRDIETGEDQLNPPAELPIHPGLHLIYLAPAPVLPALPKS